MSDRETTHQPHKIYDQYRECKTGGGACFAFPRGPDDQKNSTSLEICNLDQIFKSRSNISISTSRILPQKIGLRWMARSKISFSLEFSSSLEISNLCWSLGPLGFLGSDNWHTTPPKNTTQWGTSFVGIVRGSRYTWTWAYANGPIILLVGALTQVWLELQQPV